MRSISPDLIQTLGTSTEGGGCTGCQTGGFVSSPNTFSPSVAGGLRPLTPVRSLKNLNFNALDRVLVPRSASGGKTPINALDLALVPRSASGGGGVPGMESGGDGGGGGDGESPAAGLSKLKKILVGGAILVVVVLGGVVLVKAAIR